MRSRSSKNIIELKMDDAETWMKDFPQVGGMLSDVTPS